MSSHNGHIDPSTLQLSPDTPAWVGMYFDRLSRQLADVNGKLESMASKTEGMADELETLRRLLAPRLVNRKECARIAGVNPRTIQRYEEKGYIHSTTKKGNTAYYLYTDAAKLKKMVK